MSYGLQIYKSDGVTLLFDSTKAVGGVYVGQGVYPVNTSGTHTWTESWLTNRSMRAQIIQAGNQDLVYDMNGAQPRVTWTAYYRQKPRATIVTLWAE